MNGARPFRIVPVIDIRDGVVVRARAGDRQSYRPIETPLSRTPDPLDVAQGLLTAVKAEALYVADLDAIEDRGRNDATLRRLADACAPVELWVDAGFASAKVALAFLDLGFGRVVLGSESQVDERLVQRLGDSAILSLDSLGSRLLGPAVLHEDASLWPSRLIVMSLAQVGSGGGPDLERIAAVRRRAPGAQVFAAGGLRGPEDITRLVEAGAAGALVASALHDGRLRQEHLQPSSA